MLVKFYNERKRRIESGCLVRMRVAGHGTQAVLYRDYSDDALGEPLLVLHHSELEVYGDSPYLLLTGYCVGTGVDETDDVVPADVDHVDQGGLRHGDQAMFAAIRLLPEKLASPAWRDALADLRRKSLPEEAHQ